MEIIKHHEADNLMSYEEQVESERQEYDVHEAFYSVDERTDNETDDDIEGAFYHAALEEDMHLFTSLQGLESTRRHVYRKMQILKMSMMTTTIMMMTMTMTATDMTAERLW